MVMAPVAAPRATIARYCRTARLSICGPVDMSTYAESKVQRRRRVDGSAIADAEDHRPEGMARRRREHGAVDHAIVGPPDNQPAPGENRIQWTHALAVEIGIDAAGRVKDEVLRRVHALNRARESIVRLEKPRIAVRDQAAVVGVGPQAVFPVRVRPLP
jgi:hypothetical protein